MSRIKDWSTTPADNELSVPYGAPETWKPSDVDKVTRQEMATHRVQWEDAEWFNWGHEATQVNGTTFTVQTDLTGIYLVGRRLKINDSSTLYGTITSSSYSSPNTTIEVNLDSGSLTSAMNGENVFVSIHDPNNSSLPPGTIDYKYYAETSGTDTYTATMTDPKISEYETGRVYMINFINASTSEDVTLNINSIGAKTVLLTDASKPQIGDIKPHHRTRLIYDGTNFLMLDPYLNTKHAGIASSLNTSGYTRTRDGFILQWGRAAISNGSNTGHADITFPIAFPNNLFSIATSYDRQPSSTYGGFHTGAFNQSKTGCRLYGDLGASGTIDQPVEISYIAIGN